MKWVKKFQALSNLCASCSGVLALLATFVLVGSQNAYADLVSAPSEHRMALVIENSDYRGSIPTFPEADGKAVAEKLRSLGVEVELKLDLDKNALQEAVAAFRQKIISARADASTSVTAVFYFSGVGAIPVSSGEDVLVAIPKAGADLFPDSGVPLQWVVDQLGVASQSVLLLRRPPGFE